MCSKLSLLFSFLLLAYHGHAQIEQQRLLEIPIRFEQESYSLLPLDSSGIVLYRSFSNETQQQIELVCLDSAFQQTWRGFLTLPQLFSFIKITISNGRIYLFCKKTHKQLGYMVYSVDAKDGRYISIPVNEEAPFHVTDFTVTHDAFLVSGYFKFRPVILWYSIKTRQSKLLSGFINQQGELVQVKPYLNGEVDVVVSTKNSLGKKSIWVQHYSNDGTLLKTITTAPDESKNLIFGRAVHSDSSVMIAGIYGRNIDYARGIFATDVNTYGECVTHHYNFAELKNFFRYLKPKREMRIQARIERRKIKGKKNKFNYRFLVNEVVPFRNQYIMIGEAFNAQYSNYPNFNLFNSSYGNSFSPWTYGVSNGLNKTYSQTSFFNGFHYTHAVIVGFDENANLLWDNSFELNNVNSAELEQHVKVYPAQNHIVLLYLNGNIISTKIIKGTEVIEATHQYATQPLPNEMVIPNSTSISNLDYWHDNHFLVYGVQAVIHNDVLQKVFFINKIDVH